MYNWFIANPDGTDREFVALAIWSKLPFISNPILWIILGALAGYLFLSRSLKNQKNAD